MATCSSDVDHDLSDPLQRYFCRIQQTELLRSLYFVLGDAASLCGAEEEHEETR